MKHIWLVLMDEEGERRVVSSAYTNREAAKEYAKDKRDSEMYDNVVVTKRLLKDTYTEE